MAYKKHLVVSNSRSVTIRDKNLQPLKELKPGDIISVDTSITCWSWTDREYYKVEKPDGWILKDLVGEVLNGKHFSKG